MQNDSLMHCLLNPLQAANCCCNSRLIVDEDDLTWVAHDKSDIIVIKTAPRFRKLSHYSDMQNDALMHREGYPS